MDLLCFSHLRWNFVFQRPQHLLTRFATTFRTFYIEEPVFTDDTPKLQIENTGQNLYIVTPFLPHGLSEPEILEYQQTLVLKLWPKYNIKNYIAWFYTPMALPLMDGLPQPAKIVYDCMDELSNFKFAPPEMHTREKELMELADVVFTGGHSLYEAKKHLHHNIHAFPSSIDKKHFAKARNVITEPPLKGPCIGFFGVIDERMDIDLLNTIATRRPDWNLMLIGPVVKIDPESLPQLPNIHYLGAKDYDELPAYLGGWDVALIPFALNESTQFISPTKTPEYLAGGVPVVSTAIRDIINPYERKGLVYIGKDEEDFIKGIELSLTLKKSPVWVKTVDLFLKDISWDNTWEKMLQQVNKLLVPKPSLAKRLESQV